MTKLQMVLSQRVFNIFSHLKKLVKAEMFYFSKIEVLCLSLMCANNQPIFSRYNSLIQKKLLSNFKKKLTNFTFQLFENYKENAKNVAYQRLNPIKTRGDRPTCAKCIFCTEFFQKKTSSFNKINLRSVFLISLFFAL